MQKSQCDIKVEFHLKEKDKTLKNVCKLTKIDEKQRQRNVSLNLTYDSSKNVNENVAKMMKFVEFEGKTPYTLCMERALNSYGQFAYTMFIDLDSFKQ